METWEGGKRAAKLLLQECDLPPRNPKYLKEITETDFKAEFSAKITLLETEKMTTWWH